MAELRNVEHPHLKDDEFDLIDMIKIEGKFVILYLFNNNLKILK